MSEKSSGSSILQRYLCERLGARTVAWTQHQEQETLFWTKAASVLDLPQTRIVDSVVPLPPNVARRELLELLGRNIPGYLVPKDDESLVFEGWERLSQHCGPIFVEKSPHHLCQQSALNLMMKCRERGYVDFLFVGLIRNPLDTLYSQFIRWRTKPGRLQPQWVRAYENLEWLCGTLPNATVVVRYEDLAASVASLRPVFDFCGRNDDGRAGREAFVGGSIGKWRSDTCFGFVLSEETKRLARRFGYLDHDLDNAPSLIWHIHREVAYGLREARRIGGSVVAMVGIRR